jgi:hypothetical protein
MRVLCLSDLQAPFAHQDSIDFLIHINTNFKCDHYVCLGDEADFSKLSVKHFPDPNGPSASDEHQKCLEFLHKLYKKFPVVDVCISNHTMRPLMKAAYAGIPEFFLKSYSEFLQAPDGWRWKDRHDIDNVIYQHGMSYAGQTGHIKAAIDNRRNTVIGHLASFAGINYITNFESESIWGANFGCLIDVNARAFNYGKYHGKKPCLGTGVVINGVPIYLPMKLDKHGRWTGKL